VTFLEAREIEIIHGAAIDLATVGTEHRPRP
jgi:hypothetical protein